MYLAEVTMPKKKKPMPFMPMEGKKHEKMEAKMDKKKGKKGCK